MIPLISDFEKKEGELRVVSKVSGKSWEIVQIEASETHHKARFIKLPAGNAKYQYVLFVDILNFTVLLK